MDNDLGNIFNYAEVVLRIAVLCPQTYNSLVRLNRYLRKELSQRPCLLEVFPNYGLCLAVEHCISFEGLETVQARQSMTNNVPMEPVFVKKIFFPPLPMLPELASIQSLQQLEQIWECDDDRFQLVVNSCATDGKKPFLRMNFKEFWYKEGVGVTGGIYNNRVLLARSLAQFLSDWVQLGMISLKGISMRKPRVADLEQYWLWPKWPNCIHNLTGLCSKCCRSATAIHVCHRCQRYRLCDLCFREHCEPSSDYEEDQEPRSRSPEPLEVFITEEGSSHTHAIRQNGYLLFCSRCKVTLTEMQYWTKKKNSCQFWCNDCAPAEENVLFATECKLQCTNCDDWMTNDDTWFLCRDGGCRQGAMHAICEKCKADEFFCSLSHDASHIFDRSSPDEWKWSCKSCSCRIVDIDAWCPYIYCDSYYASTEGEESSGTGEEVEPLEWSDVDWDGESSDDSDFLVAAEGGEE